VNAKAFGAGDRPVDWATVLDRAGTGVVISWFAFYAMAFVAFNLQHPSALFTDATLYWKATAHWLAGDDPWTFVYADLHFAAPPPALLLNLPLQPFGAGIATAFWPIADAIGAAGIVYRFKLTWWWVLFPPFIEGTLAGSPDIALAALVLVGGGWLTVAAKPYAAPSVIAARRWRSIVAAAILILATSPLLPWAQFVSDWPVVSGTLVTLERGLSAWGSPILLGSACIALLFIPRRIAGEMVTPALWPLTQLHYHAFSTWAASRSRILAIALSVPLAPAPVIGLVVYALLRRFRAQRDDTSRGGLDPPRAVSAAAAEKPPHTIEDTEEATTAT
jgi:hypothetical protein